VREITRGRDSDFGEDGERQPEESVDGEPRRRKLGREASRAVAALFEMYCLGKKARNQFVRLATKLAIPKLAKSLDEKILKR
jgi:hypothetical protein